MFLSSAERTLSQIPKEQHNKLAHFLEGQDLKELALRVSSDPEHRFELALSLKRLEVARDVLTLAESETKWRQLGDLALAAFDLALAEECFLRADDFASLLLLHTCSGNAQGMATLAESAARAGRFNVAFVAHLLLQRVDDCISLLCDTGRVPEAAFMARTYAPSQVPQAVAQWRDNLRKVSERAAQSLADPDEYPDLFPELEVAQAVERFVRQSQQRLIPAFGYVDAKANIFRNLLEEARDGSLFASDEDDLKLEEELQAEEQQLDVPEHQSPVVAPTPALVAAPSPAPFAVATATPLASPTKAAAVAVAAAAVVASPAPVAVETIDENFDLDAEVDGLVGGADVSGQAIDGVLQLEFTLGFVPLHSFRCALTDLEDLEDLN